MDTGRTDAGWLLIVRNLSERDFRCSIHHTTTVVATASFAPISCKGTTIMPGVLSPLFQVYFWTFTKLLLLFQELIFYSLSEMFWVSFYICYWRLTSAPGKIRKQILLQVISGHMKGKKVTGQIIPDQPDRFLWQDDQLGGLGDAVYLDCSIYLPQYPCRQRGLDLWMVGRKLIGQEGSKGMTSGAKSSWWQPSGTIAGVNTL